MTPRELVALASQGLIEDAILNRNLDLNKYAFSTTTPGDRRPRTALQAASEGGHVDSVRKLLRAGADVNAPAGGGGGGRTALQAAAEHGYLEIFQELVLAGANVNALPARCAGLMALHAAAKHGHLDIADRLLMEGADINCQLIDKWSPGLTPLYLAAETGHTRLVHLLLEKGALMAANDTVGNATELTTAAAGGYLDIVELLLNAHDSFQFQKDRHPHLCDKQFGIALGNAAQGGHTAVVMRLLDFRNMNRDAKVVADKLLRTPLTLSAGGGNLDIFEMFLAAGAQLHGEGDSSFTCPRMKAIVSAAENGHESILKFLLRTDMTCTCPLLARHTTAAARSGSLTCFMAVVHAGGPTVFATKDHMVGHEMEPIEGAAQGGSTEILEFLLQTELNLRGPIGKYFSAVHYAVQVGNFTNVKLLVNHGGRISGPIYRADVSGMSDGLSPLQEAAKAGNVDIVRLLIDAGAPVNDGQPWNSQPSALGYAAAAGHLDIVKFLIKNKAEINGRSVSWRDEDYSALQMAAGRGQLETVDYLLGAGARLEDPPRIISLLLRKMYRMNKPKALSLHKRLFHKVTPLQRAAKEGHQAVVQRLLQAGADPRAPSAGPQGPPVLHGAASSGNLALVKELLSLGLDVDEVAWVTYDTYGGFKYKPCTALQAAAANGYADVVELLLASPGRRDDEDLSASLEWAVRDGFIDLVDTLSGAFSDPSAKEAALTRALTCAQEHGELSAVDKLQHVT